jgi:hypothetical protein
MLKRRRTSKQALILLHPGHNKKEDISTTFTSSLDENRTQIRHKEGGDTSKKVDVLSPLPFKYFHYKTLNPPHIDKSGASRDVEDIIRLYVVKDSCK